jgi:hypothetical protein
MARLGIARVERLEKVEVEFAGKAKAVPVHDDRMRIVVNRHRHAMQVAFVDPRNGRKHVRLIHPRERSPRLRCDALAVSGIGSRAADAIDRAGEMALAQFLVPFEPAGCQHDAQPGADLPFPCSRMANRHAAHAARLIEKRFERTGTQAEFAGIVETAAQQPGNERMPLGALGQERAPNISVGETDHGSDRPAEEVERLSFVIAQDLRRGRRAYMSCERAGHRHAKRPCR